MGKNYLVFATNPATVAGLTPVEKAILLATLKSTYAAALDAAFEGLLPGAVLVEFGAEMTTLWAALGYTPKAAVAGAWAA